MFTGFWKTLGCRGCARAAPFIPNGFKQHPPGSAASGWRSAASAKSAPAEPRWSVARHARYRHTTQQPGREESVHSHRHIILVDPFRKGRAGHWFDLRFYSTCNPILNMSVAGVMSLKTASNRQAMSGATIQHNVFLRCWNVSSYTLRLKVTYVSIMTIISVIIFVLICCTLTTIML